jgi:predicted transcriptional regulator
MDKKQKEALVLALSEKGKTYREITKEAWVSPNTIKAVLNKAGLDQNTSISSRVFELYSQQKTPLEVAITLGLKSDEALRYHQEYFMLIGCTELTKIYLQIKDNPGPYVNLVKLTQKSGMRDGEVVELLKIANGYLPRIRLEYDRLKGEKSSLQAELNSWKAEIDNAVRIYQDFCDRNVALKNREDELQLSIKELKTTKVELQKPMFNGCPPEFQESDIYNLNPENRPDEVMNDGMLPPTILNETLDYSTPPILTLNGSSETLPHIQSNRKILDTRELSHFDPAIDNKAFQVYPEPKEESSGSSIRPRYE